MRLLRLNRGAERVPRHGEAGKPDELWVGTAFGPGADERDIDVYMRVAQAQPIVAELLCSVVGRAMGLPIPEPFIIAIGKGDLPGSMLVDATAPVTYAFACKALEGEEFAQLMREDSDTALQLLLAWQHLVPVTAFDEWLANTDRNLGNILFAARSLWLIDHADALGGSARRLYALGEIAHDAFTNKLGTLFSGFNATQRRQQLDEAARWLVSASTLNLGEAVALTGLELWHSAAEQAELLDFVKQRLAVTHSLLCTRLGHPQLTLPPPTASAAASADGVPSSSSAPA